MIKVNLLNSVTDRPKNIAVEAIETKVTNPRTQSRLLLLVIAALTALAMGFDWTSARSAHENATAELARQQQIAAQMAAISREQAELEKKTKDVQVRIDAIKKLRNSQQGPVAVLSAINERLPQIADFRLQSIEQKGGDVIIKGDSPNEGAVTQFGRSLEFSSGLFTNVNLETERKKLDVSTAQGQPALEPGEKLAPSPETVNFTIKCKYAPAAPTPQQQSGNVNAPASQLAQK